MINIIEYDNVYDESIKDLLVELQEHLIEVDDWKTQVMYENYREENFDIDIRKVKEQEGKIYLAKQDDKIIGLVIGVVDEKDEIDLITNDCAKTGSVIELIISKESRGTGIGRALLNKIETYFSSIGCKRINIEVFGPNKSAYNFYSKNGYADRDYIVSKRLD